MIEKTISSTHKLLNYFQGIHCTYSFGIQNIAFEVFRVIFQEDLISIPSPPPAETFYQNNSITIFLGKCPGTLTRKSRKSPEKNSTGIYFGKSPFLVRAPLSEERRRGSHQTPKIIRQEVISVAAPGALTGFFGKSPENIIRTYFFHAGKCFEWGGGVHRKCVRLIFTIIC